MKRNRIVSTLAVALVAGLASVLLRVGPAAADGIGVYPTIVTFDDTLRGGEYFSTLGMINNSDVQRTFTFEVAGDIAPWVSFVDPADRTKVVDKITAPKRGDGYVVLRLRVPDSAQNGSYTAEVRTVSSVEGEKIEGSGATLNLAAAIGVKATVSGKQRIEGSILDVAVNDIEVGYPLRVRTKIENTGNVRVLPEVHVEIATSGKVIGTIDTNDVAVPPNENREIESQWDSNVAGPGDYTVTVSVALPGLSLGARTQPLKIMPRGTLTRQGIFESLELENEVVPGSVARVVATFRNTGKVESMAVFAGELYRDGALVKPITSLQKLVRRDDVQKLEALVEITAKGTYTIKGKVNFEGKETEEKELTFRVGSSEAGGSTLPMVLGAGGGGAGLLIIAAAALYWRRRGRAARVAPA